ncbi:MAG: hypothetical protein JW973_05830 [Bacteroidales bacterium]|nr:hypothetical protein [Bacteroidales bacterium]
MSVIFLCLLFKLTTFHPVHISYTNVDIDTKTGDIQLIMKFFSDDLCLLFYHLYDHEIMLESDKEMNPGDVDKLSKYLLGAFIIRKVDEKPVKFEFIRKEQNEESIWLYFHGKFIWNNPGKILIMNTLLLDVFEDQTNLVLLTAKQTEKGYSFNFLTREMTIDLND